MGLMGTDQSTRTRPRNQIGGWAQFSSHEKIARDILLWSAGLRGPSPKAANPVPIADPVSRPQLLLPKRHLLPASAATRTRSAP